MRRFQTDSICCACQHSHGRKEVKASGGGGAKWNAGNRTFLDFNFVKKRITEETEDLHQSDKQGDKKLFLYMFRIVYEIERPITPSIPRP